MQGRAAQEKRERERRRDGRLALGVGGRVFHHPPKGTPKGRRDSGSTQRRHPGIGEGVFGIRSLPHPPRNRGRGMTFGERWPPGGGGVENTFGTEVEPRGYQGELEPPPCPTSESERGCLELAFPQHPPRKISPHPKAA